jgi:hypothetical protein
MSPFFRLVPSDVTYVALKAGTIDATMLQIRRNFSLSMRDFAISLPVPNVYRAVMGGLTTTKNTITERPELVSKTIRQTTARFASLKVTRYAIDFMKGPYLDLSEERERFAERVYDAPCSSIYHRTPWMKRSSANDRDRLQRVKPAQPVPPERVFDFSFTQK